MIGREEYIELLLQTGADIALRRQGDPRWRQLAGAIANSPPLAQCTSGNYDADGNWYNYFRYSHSGLDGEDGLGA